MSGSGETPVSANKLKSGVIVGVIFLLLAQPHWFIILIRLNKKHIEK
jgi:hypothetical protein